MMPSLSATPFSSSGKSSPWYGFQDVYPSLLSGGGGNLSSRAWLINFRLWLAVFSKCYLTFWTTKETHTRKMNGIHKFQVDAIKTSRMRIFTVNPTLFKVWLSSAEMLAFFICNWLVILSTAYIKLPHLFFPNGNIWWRSWTSTCDESGVFSSHSLSTGQSADKFINCKSYVKCLYSSRSTCLS